MRDSFQQEVEEAAARYEQLNRDQLLMELTKLARPSQYKDVPSDEQLQKEGATLWTSYRHRLAHLICSGRTPGGDRQFNAIIGAGLVAFIKDIGAAVLGGALGADVTTAMIGAIAVLLYQELQSGVDAFCATYFVPDED